MRNFIRSNIADIRCDLRKTGLATHTESQRLTKYRRFLSPLNSFNLVKLYFHSNRFGSAHRPNKIYHHANTHTNTCVCFHCGAPLSYQPFRLTGSLLWFRSQSQKYLWVILQLKNGTNQLEFNFKTNRINIVAAVISHPSANCLATK